MMMKKALTRFGLAAAVAMSLALLFSCSDMYGNFLKLENKKSSNADLTSLSSGSEVLSPAFEGGTTISSQ